MSFDQPEIFNTDQGAQFTSGKFTGILEKRKISVSMDGRGRALDNLFIERLWRTVKYEEVYLRDYKTMSEAYWSLDKYFRFYNTERSHQALGYQTPCMLSFVRIFVYYDVIYNSNKTYISGRIEAGLDS